MNPKIWFLYYSICLWVIKATRYTVIKYIVCSVWLLSESFHVSVKHFNLSVIMPLDRLYEEDDVIAFCF